MTRDRKPGQMLMCTDIRYREVKKIKGAGLEKSPSSPQPRIGPDVVVGPTGNGPRPGMRKPGLQLRSGLQRSMTSWAITTSMSPTPPPYPPSYEKSPTAWIASTN